MLNQLNKDARLLEKQIVKTTTTGDKASLKIIQRELNSIKRMIG